MSAVAVGIVILLLVTLSVRERIRIQMQREKDWSFIGEAKPSPLSQALANLVGVAGGVYLSMVVLATFLEIQLPERVQMGNFAFEPLAALSILLALMQPFLQRAIDAWRRF
ncbi:MAG: hypothetical protein HPY89_00260 [Pelotomaculum sp.]|uniref:Hypothetical membrane protein n=1 Tax=Pelotomaculum thermopropionicum (strain DSM 13744 / JCM 10971 / SI) TaxID=370438 RepID=A5D2T1_PELTS|nr:hypothetical protein [Pelotomaculum sp.]BAF59461.1 hypothetical membrane protein [Pelotomaculum thermopropionicum SI]